MMKNKTAKNQRNLKNVNQRNQKYYVYHIPGKKVGCTSNLGRRLPEQGCYDTTQYEILGIFDDASVASTYERLLQQILGYKVDRVPYENVLKSRECLRKRNRIRAKLERMDMADEIDERHFEDVLVYVLSAAVDMRVDEVWRYVDDKYDYDEEREVYTAKQGRPTVIDRAYEDAVMIREFLHENGWTKHKRGLPRILYNEFFRDETSYNNFRMRWGRTLRGKV